MSGLSNFASHINLYSDANSANKWDLDILSDKALLTVTKQLDIVCESLKLGAVPDLEAAVVALQAGATAGSSATAAVQTSLDSAVGSLSTSISSETAQRQAALTAQSQALAAESVARASDVSTLTAGVAGCNSSIASEASARGVALASEASARASDVATINGLINVEKLRINSILQGSSVDLDSLKEVVDAFEAADSSALATMASMQSAITVLTARLDSITSA